MKTLQIKNEETLAKALKERRKELGLTQKDVAKYCRLSHNGISRIELAEKSVRLSTLLKLAKILGFNLKLHPEE